jgi:hypothetical protein
MNAVVGLFDKDSKIQYRNGESAPPLLQNTASGGPSYGELLGNARIEPVSLGGRFGKGVFLQARDSMSFTFNAPVRSDNLYLGAFIKPKSRFKEALLFTLPSGGSVRITGDILKLTVSQGSERTINLEPRTFLPDTWIHIGFLSEKLSNGKFSLSTFINGMAMSYDVFVNPPLEFSKGKLIIGGGVSGWFDEVRVAKALPTEEELCNYSYGTLAQLDADISSDNNWAKRSLLYPAFAHARIQYSLRSAGEPSISRDTRFVCLISHKERYGWAPSLPRPNGISRYLRSTLLMDGQVFHAMQPRPEARYNKFCQSCHVEANPVPGLKRENPLMKLDIVMDEDDRKQPTQPRRIWSGVTPVGILGENPDLSRSFSIYRYLFP